MEKMVSVWFKKLRWVCVFSVLGFANSLIAQLADYEIEHGKVVDGVSAAWGDTYVGKYSSGNALFVWSWEAGGEPQDANLASYDAYVGFADSASDNLAWVNGRIGSNAVWTVDSLQIGSENNSNNWVLIDEFGTLEVSEDFNILGSANGNALAVYSNGTFYVKSDFNASMDGFVFGDGGVLKVGGALTGVDTLNDQRHLVITGEDNETNATWMVETLTIGNSSSSNSVLVEKGSLVHVENLLIGSAGVDSNRFSVSEGAQAIVSEVVFIANQNFLSVSNKGILTVESDFDATMAGFELTTGGVLEARGNLIMTNLDHEASIWITGANGSWNNLSNTVLQVGAHSDANMLSVSNGAMVQVDHIFVGGTTNIDNLLSVTDGGTLLLEGSSGVLLTGTNNDFRVSNGGKVVFESDYNFNIVGSSMNSSFSWGGGGILEFHAKAPDFLSWGGTGNDDDGGGMYSVYGHHFLQGQQILILNGPGAHFNPIFYDPFNDHPLHIGDLSADNQLIVTNGAYAQVDYMTIGAFEEGGNDNLLIITGTNSTVDVWDDIALGGEVLAGRWQNGGTGNVIRVDNGGRLNSIFGDLYNLNSSGVNGIDIGAGARIVVENYYQASGSYLNFLINQEGLTNSGRLIARNTARFDEGAEFRFNHVGDLVFSQLYTNLIVETTNLVVGGVSNATTEALSVLVTTNSSLLHAELLADSSGIWAVLNRQYLADAAGFAPGTMMHDVANEIDDLSLSGSSAASNQVNILNGMSDEQVNAQLRQLYEYNAPTYMHGRAIHDAAGLVMSRSSSFHLMAAEGVKPPGGGGPHVAGQDLRGWAMGYGNMGSYDANSSSVADGYDMQVYGTVIGLDKSFGSMLLGIAGGYVGSMLETDGGDQSDATTGYGLFYASYGSEEWFGDFVASYGSIDIENESGTAFDVTSEVQASQASVYVGFGKEWALKKADADRLAWRFRPQVGLRVSLYDQDAYTEDSTNAVGKVVDAYDRMSYLSTLGGAFVFPKAYKNFGLETEVRAAWLHEFNADVDAVGYSLIGGNERYQFAMQSPDEDALDLGLSVKAIWLSGIELKAAVDGQVGSAYSSATVSGSLLYSF